MRRKLWHVKELIDSTSLVDDPESLRARLGAHGYLFFRELLPIGLVGDACTEVSSALAEGGWTDSGGVPVAGGKALNVADAIRDPGYLAAVSGCAVNRIPYIPQLRDVVRTLLGGDAFSYPVKVLRVVHPEVEGEVLRGRYTHQDYAVAQVCDLLTTWVPLMPIPVSVGGLAVLPGSNLGGPLPARQLSADHFEWATADYSPGDVLLFHCLTSHAALPNRSDRLRLSQDSRWQSADQPAPARMIYGPGEAGRGEALSRVLCYQPWWEPVPSRLVIQDGVGGSGGAPWSRFFTVHPGWSGWRGWDEEVH
jgi:Phytanoyl-CoA dioxygenase (PhyH)